MEQDVRRLLVLVNRGIEVEEHAWLAEPIAERAAAHDGERLRIEPGKPQGDSRGRRRSSASISMCSAVYSMSKIRTAVETARHAARTLDDEREP